MKRIIITTAFTAALALPTVATAKEYYNITQEEKDSVCKPMAREAEVAMTMKQRGVEESEALKYAGINEATQHLITTAYKDAVRPTEEERARVISEYKEHIYHGCLRVMDENVAEINANQ